MGASERASGHGEDDAFRSEHTAPEVSGDTLAKTALRELVLGTLRLRGTGRIRGRSVSHPHTGHVSGLGGEQTEDCQVGADP